MYVSACGYVHTPRSTHPWAAKTTLPPATAPPSPSKPAAARRRAQHSYFFRGVLRAGRRVPGELLLGGLHKDKRERLARRRGGTGGGEGAAREQRTPGLHPAPSACIVTT